jgi:hypothetical protein
MTRIRTLKTNFTAGEVSTDLLGRDDLRGYENGAARLRNVTIFPTGGVTRRPGLRHVAPLPGPGRLVAFEFNTEQTYLLAFTDGRMDVFADGGWLANIAVPWTGAQLAGIAWTQNADTLIVCHPDVAPQRITRQGDTDWTVAAFAFADDGQLRQPCYKYAAPAVELTPSATGGSIALAASAAAFDAAHAGQRFRIGGGEVSIDAVASATSATATVTAALDDTNPTRDWGEPAFSAYRGWPVSATFHQNRLVFAGARALPNRIWMSKIDEPENFDLGAGLDDEAIEFALLSDQVNAIRAIFSGRDLQVFTSGAEWIVSGTPMTPASVQARRQTRIGSCADCQVPPVNVDGATMFVPRDRMGLKEFIYTDLEQAYVSTDLAVLARHVFAGPVDQTYDQTGRLLHLVMADGTMASLTVYRAEEVTAWTVQQTDGAFLATAAVGGDVYVLTERNGAHAVERLDPALATDAALTGTSATAKATWTGLDHLEGRSVRVLADGIAQADRIVLAGAVTLDAPAAAVEIGLPFAHAIEPLPPAVATARGVSHGVPVRMIRAVLRLRDTAALDIDVGRGLTALPFQSLGDALLDRAPAPFTGDKTVRGLGWNRDPTRPLWRIEQAAPAPFTLLSVTTELKVND